MVVDGRRTNYAEGLDIYELADFMWGIGSYDAANYDGGGSSTMVLRDEDEKAKASFIVRNRPSDGSPRAVGNRIGYRRERLNVIPYENIDSCEEFEYLCIEV